jgi:hypothetical protein
MTDPSYLPHDLRLENNDTTRLTSLFFLSVTPAAPALPPAGALTTLPLTVPPLPLIPVAVPLGIPLPLPTGNRDLGGDWYS